MDLITSAIVQAVGTGLANNIIKDSYESLKATLKNKFSSNSDVIDAIDKLEKKPESTARTATLREEFENAKVNDDPDVRKLAKDLIDKIHAQPSGKKTIDLTQTNTASGNTVSGNFNFAPVQEGNKS